MPMHDAPAWRMDPRAQAAMEEVAPAQRVFLGQLLATLEREGVDFHDRISFATEVLAAQVSLLVDQLAERRRTQFSKARQLGDSDIANIVVSDVMNRTQLRRLRGADQ